MDMVDFDCKEGQKKYDDWSLKQDLRSIINARTIYPVEAKFIQEASPKKVLDIGCGNGNRLFSHLQNLKIKFIGLEKFERLIHGSRFPNDILIEDLLQLDPANLPSDFEGVDLITILGGSLLGIFCFENQVKAWKLIYNILPKNGNIIFDALIIDGFEDSDEIGSRIIVPEFTPPQYFLSKKQLIEIWKELGLAIIKTEDIKIPSPFGLRFYLLQKI